VWRPSRRRRAANGANRQVGEVARAKQFADGQHQQALRHHLQDQPDMRAAHGHIALYADRGALHVGDQIGLEQQIKAVTGGDAERG